MNALEPSLPSKPLRRTRLPAGKILGLLVLMVAGWGAQQARATTMEAMTLAELVSESSAVVVGKAGRSQSRWSEDGAVIVTDVEVHIEKVVLGTEKTGSSLLVSHLGGRMADVALTVPGAPKLKPGQRALMFLSRGDDGSMHFVGFRQGLLPIHSEGDTDRVVADMAGVELVKRDATGKLLPAASAVAGSLPLSDLIQQVRALARK